MPAIVVVAPDAIVALPSRLVPLASAGGSAVGVAPGSPHRRSSGIGAGGAGVAGKGGGRSGVPVPPHAASRRPARTAARIARTIAHARRGDLRAEWSTRA